MSEEPIAPVGEDNPEVKPAEEVIVQDQEDEGAKDAVSIVDEEDNIEDEKMPSYMNATSISSSTKPDDSRIENDEKTQPQSEGDEADEAPEQPEREDERSEGDRSGSSVVELSSGEESDRGFVGAEDEEEDYSSDEEEMDYDEEEDDEEYMRRHGEDDEDYSDGEIEAEQFERSSDDFALRPAEALESPAKERSRSLQDLSSPNRRTAKFNSKRQFHAVNVPVSELDGRADFHLGGQRRNSPGGPKYGHVTSKVKEYIAGMKEQSRVSREKRTRDPLDVTRDFASIIKRDQDMETDIRVNPQSRLLKSYMESNLKHMIVEDPTRAEEMTINRHLVENGAEIISVDTTENFKKSYDLEMVMEVDKENEVREEKPQRVFEKKSNGVLFDYSTPQGLKPSVNPKDDQETNHGTLTNGKDDIQPIANCQSVSYEDFLTGAFEGNPSQKTENQKKILFDPQPPTLTKELLSVAPAALKIEHVEKISEEIVLTEKPPAENPEISLLKAQLNQKVVECDAIKEDYKMIVNNNFQLKNDNELMANRNRELEKELNDLKKTLAQYQKEKQQEKTMQKAKEMKAAEVQTEPLPIAFDKSTVSHLKVTNNKTLSSSIVSGPSSMEQWTDSNCSPSVSLKPPNVGSILNSDDSFCIGTPRKPTRPISQAFYTSSRILQTLSNITQGKPDPANPNIGSRRSNPGQSKEPISPLVTNEYRSNKRKASDNYGTSAVGPFKKPLLMSPKLRREYNSDYETDAGDKTTMDQTCSSRTSQINDGIKRDEDDNVEEIDVSDGIKCYIYKEDDDSKERSFLLQAEETDKVDNCGAARECGPFLLGNLEVRMTEANGTLNIWGREINQESTSEDVEEDLEEDPPENDVFWAKTPMDKLKTPQFVCSTNKKQKPTAGNRSRVPRKLRAVLNRVAGVIDDQEERQFRSMPNLESRGPHNCLGCNQKPGGPSPVSTRVRNPSCCAHNHEVNDYECETVQHSCGAMQNMGCRGVSVSNPVNLHAKHSCANCAQHEEVCRHQVSSHPLAAQGEDGCCHVPKRCHSVDIPCNTRVESSCSRGRIQSEGQSLFAGSQVPLLTTERASEGCDIARRRNSGKRVRGILRDFFKSIGDCRQSHTTSIDASRFHEAGAAIPDIRVTAAHDIGLQNRPHSSNSDSAANPMADFQVQFEQLMADVEKINTRSRTLFQMMNTLCTMDTQ